MFLLVSVLKMVSTCGRCDDDIGHGNDLGDRGGG